MRIITKKIDKRISIFEDTYYGILAYDKDNLYPQNIVRICSGSGTAVSCQEMHQDFLFGEGFEKYGDRIVNAKHKLTLDKLLERLAFDFSYFFGFALHINYNANFKIHSIKHIPFEYCRLGRPDDSDVVGKIAVYNNWDRKYQKKLNKNHIAHIDIFNPDPDIIKYQVIKAGGWKNYKGQVYWYSNAGDYVYPPSPFDSVLEEVETDSKIQLYKYRSVINSFSAGHMLVWRGQFETTQDEIDFEEDLKKFMGAENAGSVFLVQLDFDEQEPELKKFEQFNTDKLFSYTEKSIQDNIRKRKKIPPVLIGDLIVGRLGTAEEILDATILYNAFTKKDRKLLTETLQELLSLYKTPIRGQLKIKELSIIDELMLAKRSKQESRSIEAGGGNTDGNDNDTEEGK